MNARITFFSEEELHSEDEEFSRLRQKSTIGLTELSKTRWIAPSPSKIVLSDEESEIMFSVIAFSDVRDPWTTTASAELAQNILLEYASRVESHEFIINQVLQKFIRSLFSKSKPSAITSTGRKAMPTSAPPKKHDFKESDRSAHPWKYDRVYSITIFGWAVNKVSVRLLVRESVMLFANEQSSKRAYLSHGTFSSHPFLHS